MNITGLNSNFKKLLIDDQEEYKGPDLFSRLPKDLISNVLAPMLAETKDLKALHETSRFFRTNTTQAMKNRWAETRKAMTVGPEQWKAAIEQGREHLTPEQQERFIAIIDQLLLNIDKVPPLPDNIDEILKAPCPIFKGQRVYQTHRLVLIPGGLSINLLGALMQFLKTEGEDNGTVFEYIWPRIVQELGDQTVAPHWVLVTRDVIPNSRDQKYADQKELLKQFPGYELPTLLEAIALVTTRLQGSNERLLPREPCTYTRCAEVMDDDPLVVGGFAPSGLFVSYDFAGANEYYGVVACRKFS